MKKECSFISCVTVSHVIALIVLALMKKRMSICFICNCFAYFNQFGQFHNNIKRMSIYFIRHRFACFIWSRANVRNLLLEIFSATLQSMRNNQSLFRSGVGKFRCGMITNVMLNTPRMSTVHHNCNYD